ncbi:hypothetical protein SUGI_0649540 [Cryptomeria japonica]|nr:hypothetical protein SUGI_0649540 [Cryptomeria japonica]
MPTMKLSKGLKLSSCKSSVDPAPGPFFLQMNPYPGKTDFVLQYKSGVSYYSSGEWTGRYFTSMPGATSDTTFKQEFVVVSPTKMYYTYWLSPEASSTMMVRDVLSWDGQLLFYLWVNNKSWNLVHDSPQTNCEVYGVCGAYGVCFTQENISASGSTDGFLQVSNMSLSDNEAALQNTQESTLQGCKTACLNNCSCTAFAFINSNCKLWFGDLLSMQANSNDRQPLFIRLAASDVPQLPSHAKRSSSRVAALSISIPLGVAVLGTLFIVAWLIQRRRGKLLHKVDDYDTPTSLTIFTYRELKNASNHFAHKLGKGAFGSVFKGTLPDNTLVAVKKLEGSTQAEKQFRAKISSIGSIQHVNLVRIRGFCVEGCRRNNDLSVQESQHYFPTWAATQIQKGNTMGIVDERIVDKADIEEVRRAAVVSILCIQKDENGKPSMAQVVRML